MNTFWRELSIEKTRIFLTVYFAPTLTVLMFGYYFNNEILRSVFSLTDSFHVLNTFVMTLIVVSALGRFLSDISYAVLSGLRHMFHWFGVLLHALLGFATRFTVVKHIRKTLQSHLTAEDPDIDEVRVSEYFDSHEHVEEWYVSVYTYATSLRTAFGAFLFLTILYQGQADFPIGFVLLILFIAAYVGQQRLRKAKEKLAHLVS